MFDFTTILTMSKRDSCPCAIPIYTLFRNHHSSHPPASLPPPSPSQSSSIPNSQAIKAMASPRILPSFAQTKLIFSLTPEQPPPLPAVLTPQADFAQARAPYHFPALPSSAALVRLPGQALLAPDSFSQTAPIFPALASLATVASVPHLPICDTLTPPSPLPPLPPRAGPGLQITHSYLSGIAGVEHPSLLPSLPSGRGHERKRRVSAPLSHTTVGPDELRQQLGRLRADARVVRWVDQVPRFPPRSKRKKYTSNGGKDWLMTFGYGDEGECGFQAVRAYREMMGP